MFDGLSLPFTAGEVLGGAFEFMKLLGPLIILGIAVYFTPRIIAVVKSAISTGGK